MDKETFANHISKLGKRDFDIACNFVLHEIFSLIAVNVDGRGDGGTDFTSFNRDGSRMLVAYQITTQKSDIKNKAYNDAKKSLNKLGVNRFFFITTYMLSEAETRSLENDISIDLNIAATVYTPATLADLIINRKLENQFLDSIGYPELRSYTSTVDYREMALYGYTILSHDAKNMKTKVYDDSLIMILYSEDRGLTKIDLVDKVISYLSITPNKHDLLCRRIDALLGDQKICKNGDLYILTETTKTNVTARQRLYEQELSSLASAQADLLKEYGLAWTFDDSRKAATWIANAYIEKQLSNLTKAGTTIISQILRAADRNGIEQLKQYLNKNKSISNPKMLDSIVNDLVVMAASHPLIHKLTLASVYLALEGKKPIAAAKALGAQRWCDINLLAEPTVAIPYMCSCLFKGAHVNKYFDTGIESIERAKQLNMTIHIPYYYIKECAGHLLMARKFDGVDLNPAEMQYSSNAFVANYYACSLQKIPLPTTFMDYLAVFSPSIRIERQDFKAWIREVMTSVQSLLTRNGFKYLDIPLYKEEERKSLETAYSYYLANNGIDKQDHLIRNDVYALLYVDERVSKFSEHWMITSFDKALTNVAQETNNSAWVNNPFQFLDMVELSNELPATKFHSLVHSLASYSDQTLAIGARMFDRIVLYASDRMQDWEFRQEIDSFKKDLVQRVLDGNNDYMIEVDNRTDEFLKKHGIQMDNTNIEIDVN